MVLTSFLSLVPCVSLLLSRLAETTANCEHARKILQKQITSALYIAADHKSAMEQTLGSGLEQVKDLQKTVLDTASTE
jgi:hypothetical protein